jgi:ankyrin repeat protein
MSTTAGDALIDDSDLRNIWIAAGDGDLSSVQAFVASGTSVNAQDQNGYTPLCVVSRARPRAPRECASHAKLAPTSTHCFHRCDRCRHAACSYRCLDVAQWLLSQGANASIRDADGDTPLMACEDPACADLLLAAGASLTEINDEGLSAYVIASWDFREEMVAWLKLRYAERNIAIPDVPEQPIFEFEEEMEEDGANTMLECNGSEAN